MNREDRLLEFCKESDTVIIYGAGKYGKLIEQFLKKRNVSIC